MKFAYFVKKRLGDDPRVKALVEELARTGAAVYKADRPLEKDTDALISFGGDGTFLSAAQLAAPCGVPVVGVNLGRMGFLSENQSEGLVLKLLSGEYTVRNLPLLQTEITGGGPALPYALNEVCISRTSTETIGVDVKINGETLPTCWGDGLLVATSAGSTAYNLSVGGPVCLPGTPVFVVSPIAPHNLGVRPLVIPSSSRVVLGLKARSGKAMLSIDNNSFAIGVGTGIEISLAPVAAGRLDFGKSNFIEALRSHFFWGCDLRNTTE